MPIAGTLTAVASNDGVRSGASADEVADIARFAANNGGAWAGDGCTALVWAITNLAGVPLNRNSNGDRTVNDNPLTPYWSTSSSFTGYSVSADTAGDGWSRISTINASNYGNQLFAGDVLRIVAHQNASTTGVHSMVVSRVEGSGPSNIWVVDNWGGKIQEHRLSEVVTYMNGYGGIATFNVQRLNDQYVSENLPSSIAGWGEGSFSDIPTGSTIAAKVSVSDTSTTEGGNLVFTVSLDKAATADTKVYFETQTGSAVSADFAGKSGYVTILKGKSSANVAVSTVDDTAVEGAESMKLVLKSATNGVTIADATGIGTIKDNDVAPSKADLVIQNARIDDTTVSVGQEVRVDWEVKNVGSGAAASSVAGVYLSKDASWSSSDIRVDYNSTTSLSAGAIDTGEYDYFNVPSVAAGTWHVLVVADEGKIVAEGNESNNVWAKQM